MTQGHSEFIGNFGNFVILQVEAMLDKTICAMASVFIGAPGSTFTEDILRLRRGWGSASHCDEYLCQGEQPNFIADNE
ncbi:O-fucosyltransferase 14 [Vitis vinifera]|uniref:O-fucosyltransferase 14 n=1 Tax=Vitis vinifera TaxID=29760 RepID=A0A438EWP9_VITVI|nr:O-fucosyltransferase 14 [Vitis vinifera]